jgi:hypothetical protein
MLPSLSAAAVVLLFVFFHGHEHIAAAEPPGGEAEKETEPSTAEEDARSEGKKEEKWPFEDPSISRVIASPTAFIHEKGTFGFDFSTYAIWPAFPIFYNFFDFSYTIRNWFEISANMYLPIGYLGFGFYPKIGFDLGGYVRMGFMVDFGIVWPYIISIPDVWLIAGGAPLLFTIGNKDYHLNVTAHFLYYRGYREDCFFEEDCRDDEGVGDYFLIFSSVGAGIRVGKHIKLTVDLLYVYAHRWVSLIHNFMPMMGLKILGRKWHLGINLMVQFGYGVDGWWTPRPYPMISFGWVYP